jgi:hypothetical protein
MSRRVSDTVIQVHITFTPEDGAVFARLSQIPGGRGRRNREQYLRRLILAALDRSSSPTLATVQSQTTFAQQTPSTQITAPSDPDVSDKADTFDDPFGIGKLDIAAAGGG